MCPIELQLIYLHGDYYVVQHITTVNLESL